MKIVILSGKGGVGKTLVAVNLAASSGRCAYLDCDVEEPNGRLFLKAESPTRTDVNVMTPEIHADKCMGCRACVQFCRFGALAFVNGKPLLARSVCHSCGGCAYLCPADAISEHPRAIGAIERARVDEIDVRTGILNPGEVSGVPIIRALLADLPTDKPVLVDAPPGTACAAMECVRAADLCVLVAEPTIYGAHNLAMAAELCTVLQKPCVAVLNKCVGGENPSEAYCMENGISIVAHIPFDETLGRLNSVGGVAVREIEWMKTLFSDLRDRLSGEVGA